MSKKKVAPGFWWDADKEEGHVYFRVGGRKGRRVRTVIQGLRYREALAKFGELKRTETEAAAARVSIPTLKKYWEDFNRLRPMKPSTKFTYEVMLRARILPALGEVRIDRITAPKLLEFRADLMVTKLSPSSINRYVGVIRMLLNEARLRGLLREHPAPAGSVPPLKEPESVVAYLSPSERDAFLAAFDDEDAFRSKIGDRQRLGPVRESKKFSVPRRFGAGRRGDTEAAGDAFLRFQAAKPLFLCALDAGLSRSDLIALPWHQVDLEGKTIRTLRAKTGIPVVIPLTKRLHEALTAVGAGEANEPVFRTKAGESWSIAIVKRYFAFAKLLAGIKRPFRFHDMRHDFASALAQEGVSLYVIAQLLGHTSTRMTMRYAHLHPASLRAAIESLPGR